MLYVVVEELIPEARLGEHSNAGTLAVMAGFLLMMVLDVRWIRGPLAPGARFEYNGRVRPDGPKKE